MIRGYKHIAIVAEHYKGLFIYYVIQLGGGVGQFMTFYKGGDEDAHICQMKITIKCDINRYV